MIFKRPEFGATRTVVRFAWLPIEVPLKSRSFVWLGRYLSDEEFSGYGCRGCDGLLAPGWVVLETRSILWK